MARFTFLLFLLISTGAHSQSYDKIKKDNQKIEPIVRYYKFYDGVQMIELDYLSAYHNTISRLEREHPRAMHWSQVIGNPPENVFIFRNKAGIRVKQFGKIKGNVKLLSVKKSKEKAITHNHFSSRISSLYGSPGVTTRVYPYYLVGSNLNFIDPSSKNKLGLIDSLGNLVLEQAYDRIISNFDGSIILTQQDSIHEIRNNELEVEFSTSEFQLFLSKSQREVGFREVNSRLYGLKDAKGKTMIPNNYQIIWSFNEYGLARVRGENHLEGFVDSTGREVIEAKYQNFGKFTEGLIGARINNKWGFLDVEGKTVIPCMYEIAFWFEEGLSRVSKRIDGIYYFGYIDKEGNEVIPLKYSNATDFKDGVAEVRTDFEHESGKIRPATTAEDIKKGRKPKRVGDWIKIDRKGNEVK